MRLRAAEDLFNPDRGLDRIEAPQRRLSAYLRERRASARPARWPLSRAGPLDPSSNPRTFRGWAVSPFLSGMLKASKTGWMTLPRQST